MALYTKKQVMKSFHKRVLHVPPIPTNGKQGPFSLLAKSRCTATGV